eukprot:5810849-Prymnesium_polylepis.1
MENDGGGDHQLCLDITHDGGVDNSGGRARRSTAAPCTPPSAPSSPLPPRRPSLPPSPSRTCAATGWRARAPQ